MAISSVPRHRQAMQEPSRGQIDLRRAMMLAAPSLGPPGSPWKSGLACPLHRRETEAQRWAVTSPRSHSRAGSGLRAKSRMFEVHVAQEWHSVMASLFFLLCNWYGPISLQLYGTKIPRRLLTGVGTQEHPEESQGESKLVQRAPRLHCLCP